MGECIPVEFRRTAKSTIPELDLIGVASDVKRLSILFKLIHENTL